MKKILSIFIAILPLSVIADIPHITPATGCPTGQICCPVSITCDFLMGCGNTEIWQLEQLGNIQFTGIQTFNLSKIHALNGPQNYVVMCIYNVNGSSSIVLNSIPNYSLIGNWIYGFMKQQADCQDISSLECTAKNN